MPKLFNPLLDTASSNVQPALKRSEEVQSNDENLDVICGPVGVEIPAKIHTPSRTVTPVLK